MPRLLLTGLVCLSAGCASMTALTDAPTVRVDATSVSGQVAQDRLEFMVPLVITNGTSDLVQYDPCGAVLERQFRGDWRQVWSATCTLQTRPLIDIQAGSTLRSEVLVSAPTRLSGPQTWPDDAIDGEYRMRVLLARPSNGVFAPPINTSNTFILRTQR